MKPRAMCMSGRHEMSGDNLYIRPNGVRECRACKREYSRGWDHMYGGVLPVGSGNIDRETKQPRLPPAERWRSLLEPQPNGCIYFRGPVNGGYGVFSVEGKAWRAHRYAWHLAGRELPPWPASGMVLHHTCSNSLCVNVEHLELVTNADNASRPRKRKSIETRGHCECCQHHKKNQGNTRNRKREPNG